MMLRDSEGDRKSLSCMIRHIPPRVTERGLGALALVLVVACARQGLPPGGPKDVTPPEVIAVEPDSGATNVPLDAEVAITFSKAMNRATVLEWVMLSPPRDFGKRSWKGNTFRLGEGEDFEPDVTTTVVVGTGCVDERERVAMVAPYLFVFSTGDSLDPGRIEGSLAPKNQRAHGALIWVLDLERAAARPDTLLPDYITQTAADSTFVLIGLKTGRPYLVMAHSDANRDREFDRDTDFMAIHPDTVTLDPAAPVARGIVIDFRDPRAPGSIAGTVIDSTGLAVLRTPADSTEAAASEAAVDSAEAAASEATAESIGTADSLAATPADSAAAAPDTTAAEPPPPPFIVEAWPQDREPEEAAAGPGAWLERLLSPRPEEEPIEVAPDTLAAATAEADSLGEFALENLPPGLYRVRAFLDQSGNQRYDAGEPASAFADSIEVTPLEETAGVILVVGRAP